MQLESLTRFDARQEADVQVKRYDKEGRRKGRELKIMR
jgi:hypothetical protein